jgi:hypothetical protein
MTEWWCPCDQAVRLRGLVSHDLGRQRHVGVSMLYSSKLLMGSAVGRQRQRL